MYVPFEYNINHIQADKPKDYHDVVIFQQMNESLQLTYTKLY